MCLLAYKFSKHKTIGVTPTELYLAQDLRFTVDFFRENPPDMREPDTAKDCISRVRRKLKDPHEVVRKRVDIKSSQTWYDQKARKVRFSVGQKVDFITLAR